MPDFYRLDVDQTVSELNTGIESGLTEAEVGRRQEQYGKNVLPKGEGQSLLQLIISQFSDLLVIVLIIATLISFFLGEVNDALVIMVIVVLNAALGTYQEFQAEKALEALGAMQVPLVRVRRDGEVHQISAEELVPGDLVLLQEGDRVPADGRITLSRNLQIEEAALTGESHPVEKDDKPITDDNVGIGDRRNMAFMGTSINYGRGEMIVTETGLKTQLGNIAALLMSVEEGKTPLQKQLDRLGVALVQGALFVVVVVFITGLLRGIPLQEMLLTSISLAVAAVPEGLPAIITVALSLGAARMVRRNALIRRLPAVETLGSVTTICSDKTGTLTKNEMTATLLALPGHGDVTITGIGYSPDGQFWESGEQLDPQRDMAVGRFLKAMALATDAYIEKNGSVHAVVGDTTEGALLVAAQKVGWTREQLEKDLPRVAELPFSSERKAMTTIHDIVGDEAAGLFESKDYIAITKGAPDRLVEWATSEHLPSGRQPLTPERRQEWQSQIDRMASQGLRVLGVGYRTLETVPDEVTPEVERDLDLLGLIGILDPARPEAKEAVRIAREAGVRSVMITGDHALTAEAIARDLGIIQEGEKAITGAELEGMDDAQMAKALQTTSAFARVSPEHKLRLVKVLQGQNHVVAMTGDGVNDAPALKQADIGVAMGITGTEVSKGASEMVLTDDNFASIVAAIEEGRAIYDNIRKFIRYLLGSNVGEILVMFVALLIGLPIPLLAIQILWVNLVTDGLPAIALGFEPAEQGVMKRKPRPVGESVFARGLGRHIITIGIILAIATLLGFIYGHQAYGLDAYSPTLGLENRTSAQLLSFIPEEVVPDNWDSLSVEERIELMSHVEESGHESQNELVGYAERAPRTIAFTVLAVGQMFHVLGIHAGDRVSVFRASLRKNIFLPISVLGTLILQLLVIYVPFLQATFETVPLTLSQLLISLALAALVLVAVETEKILVEMGLLASASGPAEAA